MDININLNTNSREDLEETKCRDESLLQEEWTSLQTTLGDVDKIIEDRTFQISSWLLTLSVAVLSYFTKGSVALNVLVKSLVIATWSLLLISVVLHFCSQFLSRRKLNVLMGIVASKIQNCSKYDSREFDMLKQELFKGVRAINSLTRISLVLGIILFFIVVMMFMFKFKCM